MQPALKVKYRPWVPDVEKLNNVLDAARNLIIQPDSARFEQLEQAIKDAEGEGKS